MDKFMLLTICSIVVQFATEQIKTLVSATKRSEYTPFIALAIGLCITFGTRIGILETFGIVVDPLWIDWIITAIAYSGGAVAFNELLKLVSENRPSKKGGE